LCLQPSAERRFRNGFRILQEFTYAARRGCGGSFNSMRPSGNAVLGLFEFDDIPQIAVLDSHHEIRYQLIAGPIG
jgi:hypothetical protein